MMVNLGGDLLRTDSVCFIAATSCTFLMGESVKTNLGHISPLNQKEKYLCIFHKHLNYRNIKKKKKCS